MADTHYTIHKQLFVQQFVSLVTNSSSVHSAEKISTHIESQFLHAADSLGTYYSSSGTRSFN